MALIKPSPASQVPSDTPISECVSIMNDRDIGSLLVCSRQDPTQLVGIFTERDLLRNIRLIQSCGYWSYPVSSVMSVPVVTVDLAHIDRAAALMLGYGFRHLPVVESDPDGHKRTCGIISMRDVLRSKTTPEKRQPETLKTHVRVAIRSGDPKFELSFFRILQKLVKHAELSTQASPLLAPPSHWLAILDTDGSDSQVILQAAQTYLAQPEVRAVFVLYSARSFPAQALRTLEDLRLTGRIELFQKPLNLIALSDAIGRMRIGEG